VPTDNTIVSALESAVGVAIAAKLPLYAATRTALPAAHSRRWVSIISTSGVQTASLVDRILKGENPGTIPWSSPPAQTCR
jgi:putative ABC transport system substrate-binding protein